MKLFLVLTQLIQLLILVLILILISIPIPIPILIPTQAPTHSILIHRLILAPLIRILFLLVPFQRLNFLSNFLASSSHFSRSVIIVDLSQTYIHTSTQTLAS